MADKVLLSKSENLIFLAVLVGGVLIFGLISYFVFTRNTAILFDTGILPAAIPEGTSDEQLRALLEVSYFKAVYNLAASSLVTREWMRGIGICLSAWISIAGVVFTIFKYRVATNLSADLAGSKLLVVSESIGVIVVLVGLASFILILNWRPDVTYNPMPRYIGGGAGASIVPPGTDPKTIWRIVDPATCLPCVTEKEGDIDACVKEDKCAFSAVDPSFAQ